MKIEDFPTNDEFADWDIVFGGYYTNLDVHKVITGEKVGEITPEQIEEVLYFYAYSPEGYASIEYVAFMKGMGGYLISYGGCDTTGWDCRGGADWLWAETYEQAANYGLDKDQREDLGMKD